MPLTPLPPPLVHPPLADLPVLLSVPHAGRDYPAWLLANAVGGRESLCALEDPLVDQLVASAIRSGIGAVVARAPRAAVDCNRAEDEIDPLVVESGPVLRLSPRARGGLGIVPSRTATHGTLWRRPIGHRQLEERLEQAHRPYHRAIAEQLGTILDRFGCALLLDCHSMPPPRLQSPSVVVGDRHGRSAAPWLTARAADVARRSGFSIAVNDPFAGGHVIERHCGPERGVHALQIEIDRSRYLKAGTCEPGPGFARVARLFEDLAIGLGRLLLERHLPAAAE